MLLLRKESTDLFQSESVLDYIVINQYLPMLQTRMSHYCDTLRSPILQIAIYPYCRVQLALLHHLKGVAYRLPNLFAPTMAWKYKENEWKACKTQEKYISWHRLAMCSPLPPPCQVSNPIEIKEIKENQ